MSSSSARKLPTSTRLWAWYKETRLLVSALLVCLAMTFIILACAIPQPKIFWPFFVILFHIASCFPMYLSKRRNGDINGSSPNACYEFALFVTSGIILSTFAFPIILAKAGAITNVACYLTILGSCVINTTIFGHAMRNEADEGYGGMF